MQNAPREHSAKLSTFINLPFVFKTFVLSISEWSLKTGFTVFLGVHKHCTKYVFEGLAGACCYIKYHKNKTEFP